MIYIGIDPGVSGGIASVDMAGGVVEVFAMPQSERDILNTVKAARVHPAVHSAWASIERVWSSPGWGHVGAFKFGSSVGMLRMALTALFIPFDEVLPRKWQAEMGVVYPKNAKPVDRKNISKRRAQQLFPKLTITHAIADALLMAEYCRRLHGVQPHVEKESGEAEAQASARPEDPAHREPAGHGEPQERPARAARGAGRGSTRIY